MSSLAKRISITFLVVAVILAIGLLFTYQIIPINWIGFMEIQSSFRPMEDPLPVPPRSVPIEGAAFVPGAGSPVNPISPDQASQERGRGLYEINCAICHGEQGKGDGPVAEKLIRKPADLKGPNATSLSDGEIFLVITNGVQPPAATRGGMPDLKQNLSVEDRWDVVNYVRNLPAQ
jgi:mono/diheme cytochrome c family protein